MEDKEYIECEPQVFVGFSELGDDEYKKEKKTYCNKEVKKRKKREKKPKKSQLSDENKVKAKDIDNEAIEKSNQKELNESTELLGNKRKNEDLINDIREQMIKQKNNKSVTKEPVFKSPLKEQSNGMRTEDKDALLNTKIKIEKVKPVFYSDSKVNYKENESNDEITNINALIPKEIVKEEKEDNINNSSKCNNIGYTAPSISIKSFPFPKERYYFVTDINLESINHSYDTIKDILIKKSFPIQRLFTAKGNNNIIKLNLYNIPVLKEELEVALGQTKLWYDPIPQGNNERSNNILSYSRYDIVGVTIGKSVLLPKTTVYHLNPFDIVNFRTVIVNLGPGALTHSIISSNYIQGLLNYYQQQDKSINNRVNRKSITKDYIEAMNIPIQTVNQSQYTILVLEPGMIHWCHSSLSSSSLFVYWSLCHQSIAEYNKVSLISQQISSFNINPSIPLITLRFDMLFHSLDYLPLDSIKSYYYEMQSIISDHSLDNYQQLLIESKIGLMSEMKGTIIFFCDYCHNEIFNYYSVNRTKKKAKCMQCLEATVKKSQSGIIDPNVIIIYKYSQMELDSFLARMKEKMVSCYDTNSINSISTTDGNNNGNGNFVPYYSIRSISNRKQIYKENIELIKETEAFDNFAYSYETYCPYADTEDNQFNAEVNYDLISNYLITLIDKDKEKSNYSNPLSASNKTFPYSDCDNLNEDINLLRFSPSMKTNQMKRHKEGKKNQLGAMMLDLKEKPKEKKTVINSVEINPTNVNVVSYSSKQESHLIGSSIFDFAKKVVSEKYDVMPSNSINTNLNTNTNMKVKCDNNKGNKYQFADEDGEN